MLIKNNNSKSTNLSLFDLLGNDEVALSKAFAYLLGKDLDCYFAFLRFLGLKYKANNDHFYQVKIDIERIRMEGRTDIELFKDSEYHIIIESKIKKNKLSTQRTQYLNCFKNSNIKNILCFITQERDTSKQVPGDVTIVYINWLEIIELYNKKRFIDKPIVADFLKFTTKNYKMKEIKEILIQDVNILEIERFEEFGVYRRDQTFGSPIYFAPYYTRGTKEPEGITHLSKVLGILTLKPSEIDNFINELQIFSNGDRNQINNWIEGVKRDQDNNVYTYYFLDASLKFLKPLRKDGGIKKGRGKGWIAAQIPPNRCVTFSEFIKHIPDLM